MFAYLARMCVLADAQFASPIASGSVCSSRRCSDGLSARSLARQGRATSLGVPMVASVWFDFFDN